MGILAIQYHWKFLYHHSSKYLVEKTDLDFQKPRKYNKKIATIPAMGEMGPSSTDFIVFKVCLLSKHL